MLRLRLKADLKCPTHPRFNPVDGPGAVRGSCPHCAALCGIQQIANQLAEAIRYQSETFAKIEATPLHAPRGLQ